VKLKPPITARPVSQGLVLSTSPVSFSAAWPPFGAALPGLALAGGLALVALSLGQVQALVPPAVIAVLLGMAVLPLASGERLAPGLRLCTGPLLRGAVALLGCGSRWWTWPGWASCALWRWCLPCWQRFWRAGRWRGGWD
jgi:hypothetical protein